MTAGTPSRRLILGGCAALMTLSGCSASPSPRLYMLVPRPATPVGPFVGTIDVKRVDLAKYLDRTQIVRYGATYELMLSEFNLWGEDPADMVTRVLVENLIPLLPGSQVYSDSTALTLPAPDVMLEIDIDRFELDSAGTVVLAAQWVARRKGRNDPIRTAQIKVDAKSGDTTTQVAAMSDALSQLATEIATGLLAR